MEIFNIGAGELLFIMLLALLVLGPRRIPEVARTLGRAVRELRAISDEFTRALTREVEAAERAERVQQAARQALPSAEPSSASAGPVERPPLAETQVEETAMNGSESA
jgi:sec-independent protein translocase protein TatB